MPPGTTADEEVETLPARYTKKNSVLRQELKPGPNSCDFPLTTKKT
jgi:hypothetical protein